jgi:hypothetical protein
MKFFESLLCLALLPTLAACSQAQTATPAQVNQIQIAPQNKALIHTDFISPGVNLGKLKAIKLMVRWPSRGKTNRVGRGYA